MSNGLKYIVIRDGKPLEIGHYEDTPKQGVLLIGDFGLLFNTKRQAQTAIRRTTEYAAKSNLPWTNGFAIYPVKESPK